MSSKRHPAVRIAVFACAFRVVSAVLAFLANLVFPLYQREAFTMFGHTSPFWDPFTRWDSGWFSDIARDGVPPTSRAGEATWPTFPSIRC